MSDTSGRGNTAEPWLRGTLTETPAVLRAVIHALQLARENVDHFCGELTEAELYVRPFGVAPVAFHLRHIARSIDRLLTYAEGASLNAEQMAALKTELDAVSPKQVVFAEFQNAISKAESRIRAFDTKTLEDTKKVGRKELPTTVAGLLIHVADHTQRHTGQAITTAKIVLAQRKSE